MAKWAVISSAMRLSPGKADTPVPAGHKGSSFIVHTLPADWVTICSSRTHKGKGCKERTVGQGEMPFFCPLGAGWGGGRGGKEGVSYVL